MTERTSLPVSGRFVQHEVDIVQNPALGAYLLWRMGDSHQRTSQVSPRMELHFVALPILLHRPTLDYVSSTQGASGLAQFVAKMRSQEDELLAIHSRALKLRELTLQSLAIGIASGILSIGYENGTVRSLEVAKLPQLPERLKPMQKAADKIGDWFAKHPLPQTLGMLRVSP